MKNQHIETVVLGPCTFVPVRCLRQSKMNCHQLHPTFCFCLGTSLPKSKSRSHIPLFVLELLLSNQKEKAALTQCVLEKQGKFCLWTRPPNRREDAKAEIGFTIRHETWSLSWKSQHHYSTVHLPIQIENWKQKKKQKKQFVLEKKTEKQSTFGNLLSKKVHGPLSTPTYTYAVNCISEQITYVYRCSHPSSARVKKIFPPGRSREAFPETQPTPNKPKIWSCCPPCHARY